MNIRDLFNARPGGSSAASAPQARTLQAKRLDAPDASVPVFLTPQALVSFPAATLAIKVIDVVFDSLVPSLADSNVPPFVAALLIGGVIMYYTWDNAQPPKEKLLRAVVGVVNILYLYAVAVGLNLGNLIG